MKVSRSHSAVRESFSACLLGLVLGVALPATADEVRVQIYRPVPAGALMEEALVRIRGELTAVGLNVELHAAGSRPGSMGRFTPLVYGRVVLVQSGPLVEIHAYAPGLEAPVFQSADTRHPDIDAEVVAIRVVEALRAAMVQYARQSEREQALPEAVKGFTRLEPEERSAERAPSTTEPVFPRSGGQTIVWEVLIGPSLGVDVPGAIAAWGGQAALSVGRSWYRAGILADQTRTLGRLDELEGSARIQRTSLSVRLGASLDAHRPMVGLFGVSGGMAHYAVLPEAEPGFVANKSDHLSALVSLDAGGGYWMTEHVGAYLGLRVDMATNAPEVRFDSRRVALLGRPTVFVSLGLMVGQ